MNQHSINSNSRNSSSSTPVNEVEESQENSELKDDYTSGENDSMHNSALIPSRFIDIGEERYQYGEEGKGQGEYLLGVLEEGYTLEKLCQYIIENKRYHFNENKEAVEKPSSMFSTDEQGHIVVPFSLYDVEYRSLSDYQMSDDKKVLYEYNKDKKSVVSATYYDNSNKVYFTKNRNIIDSLLLKHKVKFGDDILIHP